MGLIPRRLIESIFRRIGYKIESTKIRDDSTLYLKYPLKSLNEKRFLNIGAGTFNHKYWTNIDYGSKQYAKVQNNFVELNLIEKPIFPFEDNTIEAIYSSHTIEHIDDESVQHMIMESFRILKVGGILRITCPDASLLLKSIKFNVDDFWNWRHEWFIKRFNIEPSEIEIEDFLVREISTARSRFFKDVNEPLHPEKIKEKMNQLDEEEFFQWMVEKNIFDKQTPQFHINYWTYEKLSNMFLNAGFKLIYNSGFGQSLNPPMTNTKLFDNTHPVMSLYLEARK